MHPNFNMQYHTPLAKSLRRSLYVLQSLGHCDIHALPPLPIHPLVCSFQQCMLAHTHCRPGRRIHQVDGSGASSQHHSEGCGRARHMWGCCWGGCGPGGCAVVAQSAGVAGGRTGCSLSCGAVERLQGGGRSTCRWWCRCLWVPGRGLPERQRSWWHMQLGDRGWCHVVCEQVAEMCHNTGKWE